MELEESVRELTRTVLVNGPMSRGQLAERLGLSMASLTRLGKPLIDAGLLVEGPLVNDGTVDAPFDSSISGRRPSTSSARKSLATGSLWCSPT